MSSRILKGDDTQPAEKLVWRRLSGEEALQPPPAQSQGGKTPCECDQLRTRVGELERELEHREQNALRTGFEKGRTAGEQEAVTRLNAAIQGFTAAAADLGVRRRSLRHEAERDVVKLSVAIARRVLHRELNADPEAMLGLVKAALEKLDGREVDRIRVHPDDAAAVKVQIERLRPTGRIEIVADGNLARGAAIFESARGNLDGSVETQLGEIERGLIDRLRS